MKIEVETIFGIDGYYINPICFSITKDIVKNEKRINNFYLRFIKIYNQTKSYSLYFDLISKLEEKIYYEKYFKSFAIIFFRSNETYRLLFKNEQERDKMFNKLIKK